MFFNRDTYVKNLKTEEIFKFREEVKNGVILNDFDKNSGYFIGNTCNNFFVDDQTFKKNYRITEYHLKVDANDKIKDVFCSFFRKLLEDLHGYGVWEDCKENASLLTSNSILKDILFTDIENLDRYLEIEMEQLPKECAEEMEYDESLIYFHILYRRRNDVKNIIKVLEEHNDSK